MKINTHLLLDKLSSALIKRKCRYEYKNKLRVGYNTANYILKYSNKINQNVQFFAYNYFNYKQSDFKHYQITLQSAQMFEHDMQPLLVKMGMCSLNTNPLNFKTNRDKIIESIQRSKDAGCIIRVGNQLEVPGYMCGDHFNQYDTLTHSWQVVGDILKSGVTNGIVSLVSSPVSHHGNLYNCTLILLDSKIKGIRAKMNLADNDGYYETRWFGQWRERKQISMFKLPRYIQQITGQCEVPIGQFLIQFNDTTVALEICQEAWISHNPMIDSALDGAEIFINPSASYIERGKLQRKIQMYKQGTKRHGGSYLYANARGANGQRSYYDGGSMFAENGAIIELTPLFLLEDVTVIPVISNLTNVRAVRLSNNSYLKSTNGVNTIPRVKIQMNVAVCKDNYTAHNPSEIKRVNALIEDYKFPHARYEPSVFLWDYLRKSKAGGFFLPLSGGMDSSSVALMVYNMCIVVFKQITDRKNQTVLKDLRQMVQNPNFQPKSPQQICNKILFTCYMGTANSSKQTLTRAQNIAKSINCHFRAIDFQNIYQSYTQICNSSMGIELNYLKDGGSWRSDLTLQNIQARSRMVLSYMFAQTEFQLPKRKGFLLVLGSANLDEALRGYFTKYDCSSADINPLGSFSKMRIKQFLNWNYQLHKFEFIQQILKATPTAELRPLKQGQIAQTDQEDMGLTYAQLSLFGKLRRVDKLGPVSMFNTIESSGISQWDVRSLGQKVKHFFRCYGKNRHKISSLTPAFHFNPQSCDDNRMDQRPVMYETDWQYQFDIIDARVNDLEKLQAEKKKGKESK